MKKTIVADVEIEFKNVGFWNRLRMPFAKKFIFPKAIITIKEDKNKK